MAKSFRVLLALQGFTIKEFSEFSGKSLKTIYNWYNNDRCPYFYEYILSKYQLREPSKE